MIWNLSWMCDVIDREGIPMTQVAISKEVRVTVSAKTAIIYRIVMAKHICPYGLKALDLLKRKGFAIDDRWLTTREETDTFKAKHNIQTTPQIFISGKRIGGHDDLRHYLDLSVVDPKATTYQPVIALFAMTALMALAASFAVYGSPFTIRDRKSVV